MIPDTFLTLGEASRATGRGKSTIAKMIRRGALSATRTDDGQYRIDPAELSRAIPFPAPGKGTQATGAATGGGTQAATVEATTDALVAELRERLADLRADRERAWAEVDHWRQQAERLALAPPKPPVETPKPWTWRWLRSTG